MRSAHTDAGAQESTAEHSWRLCLWVLAFGDQLEGVDLHKLLKLCVVHDLGEAISGDIPAIHQVNKAAKAAQEKADLWTLTEPLPDTAKSQIRALWQEYEDAQTPEAVLAKGFDKCETILQHNSGANPADFDYHFNLGYGAEATARHPVLQQIRAVLDADTLANHEAQS